MIKNKLAIAVLGTCVTSASFAFNIFPELKSTHKNHPSITKSAEHDNEYTDFSGTWTGTCNTNGESEETSVTIHNDGVYFEIDGEEFNMGAVNTESTSSKWYSSTSQTVLSWNQDRTQLILGGTMTGYALPDYPYNNPQGLFTILMKGNIALNDGHLGIKVEGTTFDGLSPIDETFTSVCTFDKVK